MTTEEIQHYIGEAISKHFPAASSESGEIMTDEGGDGRFFGKVFATRYSGLVRDLFLAIGKTEKNLQIVKLGRSEVVTPGKEQLDLLLLKKLGIGEGH